LTIYITQGSVATQLECGGCNFSIERDSRPIWIWKLIGSVCYGYGEHSEKLETYFKLLVWLILEASHLALVKKLLSEKQVDLL